MELDTKIMEEEKRRLQEARAAQAAQQAAAFDAQETKYQKFQARQQLGGNKYANAQLKMDAAAQEANTAQATEAASTNAKLGAASTALGMVSSPSSGGGAADVAMTAGSGALAGAMVGGPVGAAVGGVIGGGIGLLKADAAAEQRKRDAQAQKFMQLAQIENDKANRIANSLQTMGSLMAQNMQVQTIRL